MISGYSTELTTSKNTNEDTYFNENVSIFFSIYIGVVEQILFAIHDVQSVKRLRIRVKIGLTSNTNCIGCFTVARTEYKPPTALY